MTAGYSGTPLTKKLGLKEGMKAYAYKPSVVLTSAAKKDERKLKLLESFKTCPKGCDYIHIFLKEKKALETAIPLLKKCLEPAGMIWVSWPKKASKVATEIGGADVRACGLAAGLVDVKVCAVNEIWSGLKVVIPVKDRQ